jgi:phospholipid/cholesterol/gamma-HCH transport system substrate-binding protein
MSQVFRRFLWVILPASFILIWVGIAASRQGWFEAHHALTFHADSASGLVVGMPVRVSGFRVGHLVSLSLEPDGKVIGRINIQPKFKDFPREGSELEIVRDQIIGIAALELISPQTGVRLEKEAQLKFRPLPKMGDLGRQITDRIDPVLLELQGTLSSLNKRLNDPALIAAMSGSELAIRSLNVTMVETQLTLKETRESFSALQGNFQELASVLGRNSANLTSEMTNLSKNLSRNASDLTKEVSSLTRKSEDLTVELVGLSRDVRGSWLIRGFFPGKNQQEPRK